jgi:hypothetical protein
LKYRQNRKEPRALLELILLVADLQNLKADPTLPRNGCGTRSKIDCGRGNVATVSFRTER